MSMKNRLIRSWEWFDVEAYNNRDKSTFLYVSYGKWCNSLMAFAPKNRMIYQESYCNGKTTETKYNENGAKTSIETIYNGYVLKQILKGGKWQEVREKRNDGTNIKYNSKGELIHFEDIQGNYWDKKEMPSVPICPFNEMDDFLIRYGISITEIFGENPYCHYEMKSDSKFKKFS